MKKFKDYPNSSKPKVAIIGAGISGIIMSICLAKELDIHDFIVFERQPDVGGTWYANTYPGAACDVHSHIYSCFSNLNPDWSKNFADYDEIQRYLSDTVDKFDIRKNVQFNTTVTRARFDTKVNKWQLNVKKDSSEEECQFEVDILIGSVGFLRIPNIPKEFTAFEGPWMHSANWDHSIDLTGKKVGIIGSGASAVQILPSIVNQVGELHSFQRSPPYVKSKSVHDYSKFFKDCLKYLPGFHKSVYWMLFLRYEVQLAAFTSGSWFAKGMTWLMKRQIRSAIKDPKKREQMTPAYGFGCKRVTPSDTYYQAIDFDNVTIHDGNIDKIEGKTIYLKDGTSQTLDVLILATGFKTTSPYKDLDILNLNGDHIDASLDAAEKSPQLNYGITYSEMPNFFMMYGPTTNLGHNSIAFMAECQANYISKIIKKMRKNDIAAIELKSEVGDEYWKWVQKRVRRMVWHGQCSSWYQNANGEVIAMWPGATIEYYFKTLNPKLSDYNCTKKID